LLKLSVGFLAPEEEMEYDFGTHRKDTPVFRDQGLKLREGRLAKLDTRSRSQSKMTLSIKRERKE
jgi:hypothetical protein